MSKNMVERPKITINVDVGAKRTTVDTHGETFVVDGRRFKGSPDDRASLNIAGCTEGLAEAVAEIPAGWWFSIGVCSVSCDASMGPDGAYCDKETLVAFDGGFHADIPQPSRVADAIRNCVAQAHAALKP